MYKELPLELLVANRSTPNRMSRMFSKKLYYSMKRIGLYETLTVRPHPKKKGHYEILNGHSRLNALQVLGVSSAKCDIWEINDIESRLFLATLNRVKGAEAPELRMSLLLELLQAIPKDELALHLPETIAHLEQLESLDLLLPTHENGAT